MQNSPLVSIRRSTWRVVATRAFDRTRLLTVVGERGDSGETRHFLAPFDDVVPVRPRGSPQWVRGRRWRATCRALLADLTPPGGLRSVRHARIDVMPHQLEPALAIVRGLGTRALLADEVGLGKTIQAGIVIAELLTRGAIERVLVLTPAGLRDQWATELSTRFNLPVRVADAARLRREAAALPSDVSPWMLESIAIASLDYVKRPEVLPAAAGCRWDLVVIDEAHGAAGDSDRRAAAHAIASHAAYVLLLTATPHSGDTEAFASLCSLGSARGDRLLKFRRRRADIRAGATRRVRALLVRGTPAYTRMLGLLDRFTAAVCEERDDAWLAASVLHKRAFSSAWALVRSLERRIDALAAHPREDDAVAPEQLGLPWTDPDGEQSADDAAPVWPAGVGLADPVRELQILEQLATAARTAAVHDPKVAALARLLRRVGEPVIVFTEYRDTLLRVRDAIGSAAAVIHGGLSRHERTDALADFVAGRCRVLLATDAAGEGLNLHATCRTVVNLELPWNPMRLEQRIGRVDRIGQPRTVHAVHLVGGATNETRILARLRARLARAQAAIGAPDPLGATEERIAARLAVLGIDTQDEDEAQRLHPDMDVLPGTTDLTAASRLEAARIAACRTLAARSRARFIDDAEVRGPFIVRARRGARTSLGPRMLLLWRVSLLDGRGQSAGWTVVPVALTVRNTDRQDTERIAQALRDSDADLRRQIDRASERWRADSEREIRAFTSARLARERAILATPPSNQPFQPGLFDRRTERARLAAAASRATAAASLRSRLDELERAATLAGTSATLLLILLP